METEIYNLNTLLDKKIALNVDLSYYGYMFFIILLLLLIIWLLYRYKKSSKEHLSSNSSISSIPSNGSISSSVPSNGSISSSVPSNNSNTDSTPQPIQPDLINLTNPINPTNPTNPINPTNPTNPTNPINPLQPISANQTNPIFATTTLPSNIITNNIISVSANNLFPIQEEEQPLPPQPQPQHQPPTIEENLTIPLTKQYYLKGEEITLPSSVSQPTGYIGRDNVCFRSKLGDIPFMNKREKCMACQVDNRTKWQTYDGTNTNIISTCLYSDNPNEHDPSLWTKAHCQAECNKLQNIN
jgi:hypothetical protein